MTATIEPYDDLIIGELQGSQTGEAAQALLQLDFTEKQRQRMQDLAGQARSGELTPSERAEADGYERVSSLLGILQSMARMTRS